VVGFLPPNKINLTFQNLNQCDTFRISGKVLQILELRVFCEADGEDSFDRTAGCGRRTDRL